MLHHFLEANRDTIVERATVRAALRWNARPAGRAGAGISLFLNELETVFSLEPSGGTPATEDPRRNAVNYCANLLECGFSLEEIVHTCGDLRHVVTALAREASTTIPVEESETMNGCLDRATARIVEEYSRQVLHRATVEARRRIGALAHDLRNSLAAASLSFELIKGGTVPIGGSTGTVLERSLMALRDAIDRAVEPRRHGRSGDPRASARASDEGSTTAQPSLSIVEASTAPRAGRRSPATGKAAKRGGSGA